MNLTLRTSRLAAAVLITLAIIFPTTKPGLTPTRMQTALAASTGAWTVYHHDNGHTGYDPTLPQVSTVTAGWTSAGLDGEIYASPLIYNGLVYAATLNNTVYAINQATGVTAWTSHLGTPQGGGWVCGNVAPMGILGTPVIDAAANRIYAVVEIANSTPGGPPTYRLFGLDLGTGNPVLNTPIAPTGFDWTIQQQRGALAVANGYVYVPFGGRAGDCFNGPTPYYGWVVGVPTNGAAPIWFRTPSGAESVWAAGGVLVDDTSHNVFFATGNAIPCGGSTLSDAIVRVSPTLASTTFFEPNDWQANWCSPDSDLGSASPVLISPTLMFAAGKHGGGFLLDPTNLGGVNGQIYPARTPYAQADVCLGTRLDATFGSFAYAAPFVYLECEGHGLVAVNVSASAQTFSPCGGTCGGPDWNAGGGLTFGPPIVAAGAVWVANNGGGLYAFNAATGGQIYHSAGFGINRFVTPAEAGGQVFVPSRTVIRSFNMNFSSGGAPLDLGGFLTSGPGASSWGPTRADVFVRGTDNGLWQISWDGTSWGGWAQLGGYITSDPGPVSWGSGRIDVFAQGADRQLWHKYWDVSVNRWSGWEALGGILTSGPTVSSWGSGRLDVFVRGTDNGLWHKYWDISNGRWSGWEALGGILTSDPAAISWGPDRVDVFVRGTDNGLWQRSWDPSGWKAWTSLGGALVTAPTASSCAAGSIDVFLLGTDSGLWKRTFTGGTWGPWQAFGGQWTSKPSAACRPTTTSTDVYVRGADGHLWHLSY